MASRDYESAPASETLGLDRVIKGLVSDLEALRAGQITTVDAIARSMLAKQIFNGMRLYLSGMKLLSDNAKVPQPTTQIAADIRGDEPK